MEVYQFEQPDIYAAYNLADYNPQEVGTFSVTADGRVENCNNAEFPILRSDIQLPVDLNDGLADHEIERKNGPPNRLPFLYWIRETNFNLDSVDVIVPRGVLKQIGYTQYDRRQSWSFKFCKYQGKLYGYEEQWTEPSDERHKKYSLMGMKWESYATASVGTNICSCYSMVRASVGNHNVLLSAQIDAVRPSEANPPEREYIEIKSCEERLVNRKLPRGWLQCYLAGIETLYYGFRGSDDCIISSTHEYRVRDIPRTLRDRSALIPTLRDRSALFGLINGVIDWVYTQLGEGTSGTLSYDIVASIELAQTGGHFLPKWYVRHLGDDADEFPFHQYEDDFTIYDYNDI